MSDIETQVRRLLVAHLCLETGEGLQLDAKLDEDLGADSLDTVELVMAFEAEFDVEIADDEGDALKTVRDCVELIERKKA